MSAPLVSALLLCVALTIDACQRREHSKPTTTTAAPPLSLSLSTSSFGTSLYKRLASDDKDNIIFSPLSVYTALTMTLLGAGGDTEQELRTTLGVKPGQNVHTNLQPLMASVTTNDTASNLTLSIANALYRDPARVITSDRYAAEMNSYLGSGLRTFQRPNPEEAINKCLEEVAQHEITNFLKPGTITYDTVLMLLNAVFIKGMWSSTFNPSLTEDDKCPRCTKKIFLSEE